MENEIVITIKPNRILTVEERLEIWKFLNDRFDLKVGYISAGKK